MPIDAARALIADDLAAVDKLILQQLHSDVVLINQIGHYIVNSGGKRLRPMLVLLAARAVQCPHQKHVNIAAIIEFIHTATLLHDDVVDGSDMRRNRDTANHVWGNPASVLVGDFLYSRAFEMMVAVQEMAVMDILSHATNQIAEGEVLQLLNCNDPTLSEAQYLDVVARKTATLFAAGTRIAGLIAGADKTTQDALADFGLHLGIAFQITDDALDYSGKDLDKNVGDDLDEGKPTLPLIRAMQTGDSNARETIRKAVQQGGREQLQAVLGAIESSDAIAYTAARAQEHAHQAQQALSVLPASPYRDALSQLATFAVNRSF